MLHLVLEMLRDQRNHELAELRRLLQHDLAHRLLAALIHKLQGNIKRFLGEFIARAGAAAPIAAAAKAIDAALKG